MKTKNLLALTGLLSALLLATVTAYAQGGGPGGGFGGGPGGGGGGFGGGPGGGGFGPGGGGGGFGGGGRGGGFNIDATQVRQAIFDALRQQMEVTNDDDWKVINDQVQKVYDATLTANNNNQGTTKLLTLVMANLFGGGQGGFGGGPGGGAGMGGGRGNRGGNGMAALLGGNTQPLPEEDALQRSIDNKASATELRAAIDKLTAARKAQRAKLQKAQDDLRQLLTVRQEAILCSLGLL